MYKRQVLGSCLLAGIGWLLFNDLCSLNKDYVEDVYKRQALGTTRKWVGAWGSMS